VATGSRPRIVAGSIAITLLALGANLILRLLEQYSSRSLRGENRAAASS
jgi:hypothetical protein